MSGQDLYVNLQTKVSLLDEALKQIKQRGKTYAKAEHDYRAALSKKIVTERDNGVPVTIISDICRGSAEIAKLKFERDAAEAIYRAALEAINVYKLQVKLLESQIDREYRG